MPQICCKVTTKNAHYQILSKKSDERICIDGIDIICHDEGKLKQFPPNRVWIDEYGKTIDIFCGNILAVRHNDEGEFTSIHPEDVSIINKYLN
mgnify:CR=1 FL=1